jgi:hypothetical protein
MSSLNRNARVAGLLYLTLLTAPLRLLYIPGKLFVTANASATSNNIAAHETLFRLGILSDLFTATMAIFLTPALYRLFKEVDQGLARLMVILGVLMVTPIYFLNAIKPQRDALVMVFLRIMAKAYLRTRFFENFGCFPSACWCTGQGSFRAFSESG